MNSISKTYISSLIPKGAMILDVGAYDGRDSVELAEACNTIVNCFEPNPESYKKIMARDDARLTIWPYALGAFHGKCRMNVSNHPQSDSIKTPKLHKKLFPDVVYHDSIEINITTLDGWNHSVNKGAAIDLAWVDVNGAEADFLIGGAETLKVTDYLFIEFCEKELFAKCLNRERMIKALPGFEVIGEYNFEGNFGNLLFKRKGI